MIPVTDANLAEAAHLLSSDGIFALPVVDGMVPPTFFKVTMENVLKAAREDAGFRSRLRDWLDRCEAAHVSSGDPRFAQFDQATRGLLLGIVTGQRCSLEDAMAQLDAKGKLTILEPGPPLEPAAVLEPIPQRTVCDTCGRRGTNDAVGKSCTSCNNGTWVAAPMPVPLSECSCQTVEVSPENNWREVWHGNCLDRLAPPMRHLNQYHSGKPGKHGNDETRFRLYECTACRVQVYAGLTYPERRVVVAGCPGCLPAMDDPRLTDDQPLPPGFVEDANPKCEVRIDRKETSAKDNHSPVIWYDHPLRDASYNSDTGMMERKPNDDHRLTEADEMEGGLFGEEIK